MGRSTNYERINKRIAEALKVSELIEILEEMPHDAVVGRVGHFGEMNGIDRHDISLKKGYVTPDGRWRNENRRYVNIVEIDMPDIGPDPE